MPPLELSPELECSDCLDRMSFYRSCRKATLSSEAPAFQSASLPIVPQRASCFVRPCSVNMPLCFFLPDGSLGNVINSELVREFPTIWSIFGASTISCSSSTRVRHYILSENASESVFERGDQMPSASV